MTNLCHGPASPKRISSDEYTGESWLPSVSGTINFYFGGFQGVNKLGSVDHRVVNTDL